MHGKSDVIVIFTFYNTLETNNVYEMKSKLVKNTNKPYLITAYFKNRSLTPYHLIILLLM